MSYTTSQLEMLKDLHLVTKRGFEGIAIRKGERRRYTTLERDGLVCFLSGFGRGDTYSIRLTDSGKQWVTFNFAYTYKDLPRTGQTTYQDQYGSVTFVVGA